MRAETPTSASRSACEWFTHSPAETERRAKQLLFARPMLRCYDLIRDAIAIVVVVVVTAAA